MILLLGFGAHADGAMAYDGCAGLYAAAFPGCCAEKVGDCREKRSPARPSILSRQQWNASPPIGGMKKLEPLYITIHHTATLQKKEMPLEEKMRALQRYCQNPAQLDAGTTREAWPDIPYHFYINYDGQIAEGRELGYVGDTNTDYDVTGHMLVVLEGNFEIEKPTSEQMKSLYELVGWLALQWKIDPSKIKGHKDYVITQCPGMNLEPEMVRLQQYVRALSSEHLEQ